MMLAMIESVSGTKEIRVQSSTTASVKHSVSPFAADTLSTAAKKRAPVVRWMLSGLLKLNEWVQKIPILRWVRDHIFEIVLWARQQVMFIFFNEDEEALKRQIIKFQTLQSTLHKESVEPTEAGLIILRDETNRLEPELLSFLKAHLGHVLRGYFPEKDETELQSQIEEVLDNPFLEFKVALMPNEESRESLTDRSPFGETIINAITELSEKLSEQV